MALKKDRIYTEAEKIRRRKAVRDRRERLSEQGLCVRCGKEKSAEGHTMCQSCLEKKRIKSHARYRRLRAMGKCACCQKNWAMPHMRICMPCKIRIAQNYEKRADYYHSQERRDYFRKLRERYFSEGRCITCGKPNDNGYRRCDRCRERSKEACRQYRLRQKEKAKREAG